jgi:glycosyltransferase involved in cell wall biosynthesis
VVTDNDRRGAQVFACQLATALTDLGAASTVRALAPGRVGGLDIPTLGQSRRSLATLSALRQCARRHDIVVAHGSTTLEACAVGLLDGPPFIYRQISDSLYWASDPIRRLRVRLALSRAARVVALWQGASEVLRSHFSVPLHKVTVIGNGVPTSGHDIGTAATRRAARRTLGLPSDGLLASYLGSLVPEKGVDVAIRAIAGSNATSLLIAGEGPDRGRLESLASELLPDRHWFIGQTDAPEMVLTASDMFLFPTRGGDSMPAVLIEAGLHGLAIVASDDQAIGTIVRHGESGYLVPAGDPGIMSERIAALELDPHLRDRLGRSARSTVLANFTIERIAEQWRDVVELVAGGEPVNWAERRPGSIYSDPTSP